MYKVFLHLDPDIFAIVGAECRCPADKRPHASCKHIGALCYTLEEFSRLSKIPDFWSFAMFICGNQKHV